MSRRKAPLHLKQFSGGLNTVESPLEGSLETTRDEANMVLNNDGSRQRRLGIDREPDGVNVTTSVVYSVNTLLGRSTFRWENAGGDSNRKILVVQIGNELSFFSLDNPQITSNLIHSKIYDPSLYSVNFSFAEVDGILVVATGEKSVSVFEFIDNQVVESSANLLIRDLFGVEAIVNGQILTSSQNIEVRPSSLNSAHLYNLRNQTFAIPRFASNNEVLTDPILHFFNISASFAPPNVYPSNADYVNPALKADAADSGNRTAERFFAADLFANQLGSSEAPKGHFIIDALERGASRLEREVSLRSRNPQLNYSVTSLPVDRTPNGPSVVAQHAGRVWYAGFSGVVEGGDPRSPRMNSYLLFSSLVKDVTDIGRCYQLADPTSSIDADLVDTDGGFIRIEGAQRIINMVNNAGSLFVFANNGIWRISGQNNEPFRATSYLSEKLSDRGVTSANSVVIANDLVYFWSTDGIYVIAQNEVGLWVVENTTKQTIQPTYNNISSLEKETVSGFYDDFEQSIRWVYNNSELNSVNNELVFDTGFSAFTKNIIPVLEGGLPKIIAVAGGEPFVSGLTPEIVTADGEIVTADGEIVTADVVSRESRTRETVYVVITSVDPTISFTICYYRNTSFVDWSTEGGGVNYDSYLVTQSISGGEPRTRKGSSYLYCVFRRTESAFGTDLEPINPSSCLLSGKFHWANSPNSGKWSTPRQAYRYQRVYIPEGPGDDFDTGEGLILTRNKVRGSGNSIAFRFQSEQNKNMHIYGCSFTIQSSGDDE